MAATTTPFSNTTLSKQSLSSLSLSKFPLTLNTTQRTTQISLSTNPTPNPTPTLKSRLRNKQTLYGIFHLSFSPTLAEISALSGYDFVVVDMEHGPGGVSDALPVLRALAAADTPAVVRVPECSATWAKKALDLGPQGIMFPMVTDRKEAKKAVSFCRFPPAGVRGSAHTVVRASNYGINEGLKEAEKALEYCRFPLGTIHGSVHTVVRASNYWINEGYLSNYEEDLLIMCQVECADGVKNIEEIAAVDGVDCVQMGPLDLSASLGYLWDPGNKKVREVLRKAEKGVLGTPAGEPGGAYLSGFAMPHDKPEDLRRRGYHMVSGTVDLGLFRAAALEDVKRFKSGIYDDVEGGKSAEAEDDTYWSE